MELSIPHTIYSAATVPPVLGWSTRLVNQGPSHSSLALGNTPAPDPLGKVGLLNTKGLRV